MQDYPRDVMVLWAEGFSVTRFLVGRKDRKTFLAFVRQGMKDGWDKAAEAHYGFADVEALENAWLADLRKRRDTEEPTAARRTVTTAGPRPPEREPSSIGPMPVTALAIVTKKGRVRVQMPVTVYQPRTSYVIDELDEGGKVARPVTSYAVVQRRQWREFDIAKVEAYEAYGEAVDAKRMMEWLARERPVLVSADGRKVDPFHMQVIKRGTLVLVLPKPAPPPPAEPPTPPLAPQYPVRK
jgi:hypothetical protein